MNTNTVPDARALLNSLVPPDNKFSAANVEYDGDNVEYIKSYRFTQTTASILAELCLSATTPRGSNKSFVLSGPYGTGKSHLLLQYMSLISGDNPEIVQAITSELNKFPGSREIETLLQHVSNSSLPRLIPVVVKSGLSTLRSTFSLSLQQALKAHGLANLMPEIYGEEAALVIERWQSSFPATFSAFTSGLLAGDTPSEYQARLRSLDENTYKDFCKRYSELTAGSNFTPQNNAEPRALYASILEALKDTPYDGIALIFDEFSKYLETGAMHAEQSETKLLQDLAEFASRTQSSSGSVMNFILVTHKDLSGYISHLPKNLIDGWRGVADRFTVLHMPQNLEQTSILLGEATGTDNLKVQNWLTANSDLLTEECAGLDTSLKSILTPHFARRIFPLHVLTAYCLVRLSENIGQNERSVYAFMSDEGPLCYKECLKRAAAEGELLLTPDTAFDYFEGRIREQIYDQDFTGVYEVYRKAVLALHELRLALKELTNAVRMVKTITLCELLNLDFLTIESLGSLFAGTAALKDENIRLVKSLITGGILSEHLVTGTIKLSRPDTASVDILIKNTINELENRSITTAELCQAVLAPNLIFYPDIYNDEKRITRYFRVRFCDNATFNSERFCFITKKQEYPGTDGFIYFILDTDSEVSATENIAARLESIDLANGFINVVVPVPKKIISSSIRKLLLSLHAISKLKSGKLGLDSAISSILEIVEEETRLKLGDITELLTTRTAARGVAYGAFAGLSSVRRFRYQFQSANEFSDILSDLAANAYDAYPELRNEMIVCTNPSGITRSATKEIVRALCQKPGKRFAHFKPASQHMTIIRSILERTGLIRLNEDQSDFEPHSGNEEIAPVIEFIRNWFTEANKERALRELINALTSVKYGFGLRTGVLPLIIAVAILPLANSVCLINKRQKNTELEFSAELFMSMFENQESLDTFKIRYRKTDPFHSTIRSCIGTVFMPANSSFEIPTLEKTAEAVNNWFLLLPKFSRKTAFSGEMLNDRSFFSILNDSSLRADAHEFAASSSASSSASASNSNSTALPLSVAGISEAMAQGFIKKIAAYALLNPRMRYYEELPRILDFNRNTSEAEIKRRLEAVKSYADNAVEILYRNMQSIVTKYWEQDATELKSVVISYSSKLKCNHVSHRILYKNDVQYILKFDQGPEFSDRRFLKGLAKEITRLDPKEWDVAQYKLFAEEVRFLGTVYPKEVEKYDGYSGDLADLSVNSLTDLLKTLSTEAKANKDYIQRDLEALFDNYNLTDRETILTLLKLIQEKLRS